MVWRGSQQFIIRLHSLASISLPTEKQLFLYSQWLTPCVAGVMVGEGGAINSKGRLFPRALSLEKRPTVTSPEWEQSTLARGFGDFKVREEGRKERFCWR